MPIKPKCNVCGKELDKFGGLLFSPPKKDDTVKKYHICQECFKDLVKDFKN